jgi:glycyl-tRNA synthetase
VGVRPAPILTSSHSKESGEDLSYFDQIRRALIPYCVEPAWGWTHPLSASSTRSTRKSSTREERYPRGAAPSPAPRPCKCAVLPLSKKLSEPAEEIYHTLQKRFTTDYDDAGSIGKRYRRQDEIGTPLCVTFDFQSLEDGAVTVRDRDTMEQVRLPIAELDAYIAEKTAF